ncbi:unnamed protein product [Kuraishia capsulata CBS 1993]|uniref:CUE domain-containing protein n=1 Tax=Kuraishia capsulata CBS 1993 TaxID=1382522 RepID=W6MPM9_9ASCO|nr:uncharacterized protein KUCA_T00003079001 [Kuraishia capsulata CBS 1993]CDK27102.1 unnamed protein product [Kuraishia capsulata CBS 1993]
MDNSTTTFVVSLVIAFIFLRWFISTGDASQSVQPATPTPTTSTPVAKRTVKPIKREVTNDMVEIVQSILPKIPESEIRASLQKSGSVEVTVDELMLAEKNKTKTSFNFQDEKEFMILQSREAYLRKHKN